METIDDIIMLIARRDGLSVNEATIAVEECVDALQDALSRGENWDCEDIVADCLGLEPDYLDILLQEI